MATARLMVRDHRIVLADLDRTRLDDALFAYSDIAHYSVGTLRGQQFLTAKPISRRQASLNMSAYDMTPLLRAIDFREVTGRWPVRPEVTNDIKRSG